MAGEQLELDQLISHVGCGDQDNHGACLKCDEIKKALNSWTPEVCICAAVLLPDGRMVFGHRHDDCYAAAGKVVTPRYVKDTIEQWKQGFVTTKGRFVDREEGARLMREAGHCHPETGALFTDEALTSEDLY